MSTLFNNKKELSYLEKKEDIKRVLNSIGYENALKYIIDDLDLIDNINKTQSIYLFELISCLEKALEIYPRIKNAVVTD